PGVVRECVMPCTVDFSTVSTAGLESSPVAAALGQRSGWAYTANLARNALGFIELSMGRPEQAADRLLALTDPGRPDFNLEIGRTALPDAVEVAIRAGRTGEAAARLELARGWVAAAPAPAWRALSARCQALLGERDPQGAFGEAVEGASALPPLERARTELLYGEWLRRQRRRGDARPTACRAGAVPAAGRGPVGRACRGRAARHRRDRPQAGPVRRGQAHPAGTADRRARR